MANTLSKSLGLNLADLAEMIRSKGRGKDTILAHITPKEAALLKKRGGRGSRNPDTGLLEYDDGEDFSAFDQAASDFQVAQGGDAFYQPDVSAPVTDVYAPSVNDGGSYIPNDISTMDNRDVGQVQTTYDAPVSSDFIGAPQAAPSGQDYSQFGSTLYPPNAQGIPTQLTPEQAAAAYPKLYPGGVLPTDGQQTVYTPEGNAYYQDVTPIAKAPGATTKDGKPTDYSKYLEQLLRLGLAGGVAYGLNRGIAQPAAKTAADQAQQAKTDRQNIATPYQNIGKGLISGAQAGNLSASNIQAVKAARAMAAQNISRTGGVGVLQGANSIADLEARLLDNQLTQGIKIANIGDNYAIGAIQAGQAADQALAQSQANFANQLGTLLAPMVLGYTPQLANAGANAVKSAGNLFSNPSLTTSDSSTPTNEPSGDIRV
jgi:hypothetical protein